jgi:hypothetical protein
MLSETLVSEERELRFDFDRFPKGIANPHSKVTDL